MCYMSYWAGGGLHGFRCDLPDLMHELWEEYIGETGRPLCSRVKEHLDGLKRSRPATPLGSHRLQCHGGVEFEVTVRILMREPQTSARKTLEAFWIGARNPKMNRKDECLAITNELAPFADLCGLQLPSASSQGVRSAEATHEEPV